MIPLIKDVYPSDRQKKKTVKWELERFINHPDLMIKMLPGNKKKFSQIWAVGSAMLLCSLFPKVLREMYWWKCALAFPSQNLVLSPTTPWLHYWHRWLFVKLLFTKIFVGHWRSLICTSLLLFYFRVLNVPSIYVNV